MNKKYIVLVFLTILIGVVLRFWGLNKSPPSLGFDEAALGYNAYSIFKTGKDEYGNFLPVSIRSFNDYKPSLYVYLTVPLIKVFGLNDSTVRMVSAMAGVVSLIFLFLLLKDYLGSLKSSALIFFWLSFEPWRLHFSRNAFETHLSAMFFLIGSYLLIKKKKWWQIALAFGMAAYSYHSARLSVPLILLLAAADPLKNLFEKNFWKGMWSSVVKNKKLLVVLLGFILVSLPIYMADNSKLVLTRFRQENVFNRFYPYSPKELINIDQPFLSVRNNPIYYFGGIVGGHIMSHFSPVNLNNRIYNWVKMSPQFIPGMGMLGWIEGIVFVVGVVLLCRKISVSFEHRFLLYWMIAGIAPAAATWTWFHPLRSLNIYPAVEIIVGIGLIGLFKYLGKLKYILFGLMAVTVVYTINNELLYSAYENHGEYQPGGFKEGMQYLKSIQDQYDRVIIDSPHAQSYIFLLYYQQMDPALVHKYASIRPKPGTEGDLSFDFDKFEFRKVDWPKDQELKKTVFWTENTMSKHDIEAVKGARLQKVVSNALYDTAVIITTE